MARIPEHLSSPPLWKEAVFMPRVMARSKVTWGAIITALVAGSALLLMLTSQSFYPHPAHFHDRLDLGVVFEDLRAPGRSRMKLGSHPGFHACRTRTLRRLKVLSPPFAQSETQPATAFCR